MSEKQKTNPEAQTTTIIELYQQAADFLEAAIHTGAATIEPAQWGQFGMLKATTEAPEMNGKRVVLGYDRPPSDNDPAQIDLELPLAWTDETDHNHWQTPIDIAIYESDELIHNYSVEYAGGDERARTEDSKLQPGQERYEYGGITELDAKELIAHLESALN